MNQINEIILKINNNNKIENVQDSNEPSNQSENNNNNKFNDFNTKIVPLRSVIVCSSCQGDLFNV
jgi:hypothetical protein